MSWAVHIDFFIIVEQRMEVSILDIGLFDNDIIAKS